MNSKLLLTLAGLLAAGSLSAQTLIFSEPFSYPNGPLVGAGSPWTSTSGTAGQLDVNNGVLNMTGSESEDAAAGLTGAPYTSGVLTLTADFNFSALPTTGGAYFLHFVTSSGAFTGRVWATIAGAATGTFRLGISNFSNTFSAIPTDLSLGTAHTFTLSINTATGISSLSVDGGTAVTAGDAVTTVGVSSVGVRQAAGEGTFTLDNIAVNAVPEPSAIALGAIGLAGMMALRRRRH